MTHPSNESVTLVLDVGKSNVKLLAISNSGAILETARMDNRSLPGPPYLHLDTHRLWQWALPTAADLAQRYAIDAIVPCTHGAAIALVDERDLVLPLLDYEHPIPAETMQAFAAVCPPFAQTCTPADSGGLSVGTQLFWLSRAFPDGFAKARHALTYPQYLSWRLTGAPAAEITYLGCHSHLWNLRRQRCSDLVEHMGWRALLPPTRPAWEPLGTLHPDIVRQTGLPATCRVHNGIHDSNANFALYLRNHPRPFSLISTGTWIILLSPRLPLEQLDAQCDMLAYLDLLGNPLPAGRFMGGREFELLTAGVDRAVHASEADFAAIIAGGTFLLPAFTPTGPYGRHIGSTVGPEPRTPAQRLALATLYLALLTADSAARLRLDGDLIIDGGFVHNPWFAPLVAALTNAERCYVNHDTQGTALGAAMLALWNDRSVTWPLRLAEVQPWRHPALNDYARQWRRLIR